jgi:hypothetical protein
MPALLELQRAFGAAVISGDASALAGLIAGGETTPDDRVAIHRNTILAALTNALRLTYPAVAALVGEEFFDHVAHSFARLQPPAAPLLTLYGGTFPDFLASFPPATGLPYLPYVARLEWAVDQTARCPLEDEAPPLAEIDLGEKRLALAPSLMLLRTDYPAETIWRAVLDNNDALGLIDPGPAASICALWRSEKGASVAALGPTAAAFLETLLAGGNAEAAMTAAAKADPSGDPIPALAREVLSAGFVRLTPLNPD